MKKKPMTKEEIIAFLPKRVKITQAIIDKSYKWNNTNCIGANTLKKVFSNNSVSWGAFFGQVKGVRATIHISTKEGTNMVFVKEPQFVTLIHNK